MTDSLKKAKTFFKELQNLCKQYQITIEIASGAGTGGQCQPGEDGFSGDDEP